MVEPSSFIDDDLLELTCYVFPDWHPHIRPASAKRVWMDDATDAFPYRCLPLGIANSHGWEILCPTGFSVEWNGGPAPGDVTVLADADARPQDCPEALFGLGTVTLHVQGVLRTPPGWNLHVGGPPNVFKDGIAPLSGIIETDWSPYSFTMNWKLTRPHHVVRFEAGEPIAQVFPLRRDAIEAFRPRFAAIDEAPALKAAYLAWSASRDAFQKHVAENRPPRPADHWQKLYYRGQMPDGSCPVADHRAKLRPAEFAGRAAIDPPEPCLPDPPPPTPVSATDPRRALAKAEWVMETMARQQALSDAASGVFRVEGLTGAAFLDEFFAPMRPVILADAATDWPACRRWTPDVLKALVGSAEVEFQGHRIANPRFEIDKAAHRQRIAFDRLVDAAHTGHGNDFYLTAWNSGANAAALAPLHADLGTVPGILAHAPGAQAGMIWLGPAGTFTPLHHDLTNNLLVQLVGRKRVILASPLETPKLANRSHVFSDVIDLTRPESVPGDPARLGSVRLLDVEIAAGEALFIPVGWWHQVHALEFSVSATFTDFLWENPAWRDHPD